MTTVQNEAFVYGYTGQVHYEQTVWLSPTAELLP
jgi:hypothetical protein